jgi:hypothetical protein
VHTPVSDESGKFRTSENMCCVKFRLSLCWLKGLFVLGGEYPVLEGRTPPFSCLL